MAGQRHLPLLIAAGLLATLCWLAVPSVHARPPFVEEQLPPTHVIADHVVISEVQVGTPGDANNEFIELYNPTHQNISLSGWSIQFVSGGSTTFNPNSNKKNFESHHEIPAYGHFLIAHSGYSGGIAADMSHSSFTMPNTGGTIFLVAQTAAISSGSDASIVDKVAYGNATASGSVYPEGAATSAPSPGQSIERKAFYFSSASDMAGPHANFSNSYDSGDNSKDFIVRDIPNPQNSNSPPEPCCTTVIGTLTRQGRTDHSGTQVLMWPGSGLRAITDSSGYFFISNVPAIASAETPTYTVEVMAAGYLAPQTMLDLHEHLESGYLPAAVTFPELWLFAGDLNGDNRINIFDLAIVGSHYGSEGVSPADVNGDGRVNIQDLALVSGNFGRGSEYAWDP